MRKLIFATEIKAPIQTVFDLSRSVDFHLNSTAQTHEEVVGGKRAGLMELGETVKWRAKHFGIYLTHESRITEMNAPDFFVDEMTSGHFRSFRHEHYLEQKGASVLMTDVISYDVPMGIIGWLFDRLLLAEHLIRLIEKRNREIRTNAEP